MPVTVNPASHEARTHPKIPHSDGLDTFLQLSCPDVHTFGGTKIHASSFAYESRKLYASSSSFVRSAIEAWGRHSHLVLRPEDIWFTILVQMNFYMEAHAEELRHLFVTHDGQENIHVSGNTWPDIVPKFQAALQDRIKTDWMSDWVTPGFSTSTEDDNTVATTLMMGLLKGFFTYSADEICGIPSITLLGEKEDWQRLLDKTKRLPDFGDEPRDYSARLRPILARIVKTFDDPTARLTTDFWDGMVHAKVKHSRVCGQPPEKYLLTGWILGLFYWDSAGQKNKSVSPRDWPETHNTIEYGVVPLEQIPIGYAKVKITLTSERNATGEPMEAWLVAGSMGKSIAHGAPDGHGAVLRRPISVIENQQAVSADTDVDADHAGCFIRLTHGLNCFSSNRRSSTKQTVRTADANPDRKGVDKPSSSPVGHSTIQPLSGWFLISPQKGDFWSGIGFDELDGPTVHAVNSCSGVEHYGDMR